MDSLKKFIIRNFSELPLLEPLLDNKFILATPSGIIMGTPVFDEQSTEELPFTNLTNSLITTYREDHGISDDVRLEGSDGVLYLKDVTIQNGVHVTSLPYMWVFYDQIVGVSIGKSINQPCTSSLSSL